MLKSIEDAVAASKENNFCIRDFYLNSLETKTDTSKLFIGKNRYSCNFKM
jgi:hypothetical protein